MDGVLGSTVSGSRRRASGLRLTVLAGLGVVALTLFAPGAVAMAATAATATTATTAPHAPSAGSVPSTSSPFSPGVPESTVGTSATTAAPIVTTASPGASGLSSADALAIGIGALLLITGIVWFIWRDARRRAPVRSRAAIADAGDARPGTKPKPKRKLSPQERRRRKRGRAR